MGILNDLIYYYQIVQQFRGLLVFILPFLLPKLRQLWYGSQQGKRSVLPVDKKTWTLIALLVTFGGLQVYMGLEKPENILLETGSRMQTQGDVIGSRLRKLRGGNDLSIQEELLVSRLNTSFGRALFTIYGPDGLQNCEWCTLEEEKSKAEFSLFLFTLPKLIAPYIINILAVLISTTSSCDRNARQWRTSAMLVLAAIMFSDLYTIWTFPLEINEQAKVPRTIQWVYWDRIQYRSLGLMAFNCVLSGLIYLSASGRMYHVDISAHKQLRDATSQLDNSVKYLSYSIMSKDAIESNQVTRDHDSDFWRKYWTEQDFTREKIESDERVKEAKDNARRGQRVNLNSVRRIAGEFFNDL